MPKLHDFRANFRSGRTGDALRTQVETEAYRASLYDASNMMMMSDGSLERRWGSFLRKILTSDARLETWDLGDTDDTQFLLVFHANMLKIYDMTLMQRAAFIAMPWSDSEKDFLSIAAESSDLIITDASFRTKVLSFDRAAGNFSISDFAFGVTDDGSRLLAPFLSFEDNQITNLTIFTPEGWSTGYGTHITQAMGFAGTTYDLALGTGEITLQKDFFVADHVGSRLRILDGEVEVTGVTDAKNATIKVHRTIAKRLDVNPIFLRNGSRAAEVSFFNHGLKKGDHILLFGVADADGALDLLNNAIPLHTDDTTVPAPKSGTAGTYAVKRVIDQDTVEIEDSNGTIPTATLLTGGGDVYCIPKNVIPRFEEPAMSDTRGWPTACAVHERRLWLAGTNALPDAAWSSRFFEHRDFDPGTGAVDDAIQLYGIGENAVVRHMVSASDLVIFTSTGEFYLPASPSEAISQEIVRSVEATKYGASYTSPKKYDGSIFFVDKLGQNVRELSTESRDAEYVAPPVSVVIPDWVKKPKDTAVFAGGLYDPTPYMVFSNQEDGAMIVLASARQNRLFGWQRWSLENGKFKSVASVGNHLFAVVEREGTHYIAAFDTLSEDFITTDLSEEFTVTTPPQIGFMGAWIENREAQVTVEDVRKPDVTVAAGEFALAEDVENTTVVIGDAMPWLAELTAPIAASGQGVKAGKIVRLVDTEVHMDLRAEAKVGEQDMTCTSELVPTPIDGWEHYSIGEWGREPRLPFSGNTAGRVKLRAVVMNVYF